MSNEAHASAEPTPLQKQLLIRLDNSTSSLLEAYAKLIQSTQIQGATEQQVSSFQSSVVVAGLLHAADNLLAISGELKRAKLNDDTGVQDLEAQHRAINTESQTRCGQSRLHAAARHLFHVVRSHPPLQATGAAPRDAAGFARAGGELLCA